MACDNHSRCSSPCAAAWIRVLSDSTKPHCTTQPIVTSITDSNRASTKQQLENVSIALADRKGELTPIAYSVSPKDQANVRPSTQGAPYLSVQDRGYGSCLTNVLQQVSSTSRRRPC
jgi:hypothetical protein